MTPIEDIQDKPFRGCSRLDLLNGTSLPKICQTYPAMMKPGRAIRYLKKVQKIYETRDTPLSSADFSTF